MKFLVTGGGGFIGHNVVCELEKLGHEVIILDIQTRYNDSISVEEFKFLTNKRELKISDKTIYYYGKVTDNLEGIFNKHKPDMVISLASYPRQKTVMTFPADAAMTMVTGLVNLCEYSLKHNVQKIVHISSSMVYGDFCDSAISEEAICNPTNLYGVLKLAGENILKDYEKRGLNYTILRPSAVYGPNDVSDRIVGKFILNAMNNTDLHVNGSDEYLDFTYIDDVVKGIVDAALSCNTLNKTYNISRGRRRLILEAAKLAVKIVGKGNIIIRNKDSNFPSRGTLDIHAASTDFNFSPTVDIEQGFTIYHEYIQHNSFFRNKETK